MNKLKIWFADFWPEIKDENIFLPILQKHYDVEVTRNNPDVVIHSIFGGMKETPQYKCKKILFLGENYRAKNYGSDYSISFDPHSKTNYRLPLWQFYLVLRPELKQKLLFEPRLNHGSFDRFCFFMVSNPANFVRNSFFQELNAYKRVHSYGRYMTNDLRLQNETQGKYWRDVKYDFLLKNTHKYAITFEHSSYPWYETEKLMDAFLAGSLPIYWGSPKIEEDWNKKAFINYMVHKNNTVNLIKEMDRNSSMFFDMYQEPVFTDEQRKRHIENIDNFEKWLVETIEK
jgi:hypothetical protein